MLAAEYAIRPLHRPTIAGVHEAALVVPLAEDAEDVEAVPLELAEPLRPRRTAPVDRGVVNRVGEVDAGIGKRRSMQQEPRARDGDLVALDRIGFRGPARRRGSKRCERRRCENENREHAPWAAWACRQHAYRLSSRRTGRKRDVRCGMFLRLPT